MSCTHDCDQGRSCSCVTTAQRSCEALGVCQHSARECQGVCEQIPTLPGQITQSAHDGDDDAYDPGTALEIFIQRLLIAAAIGVSLGVVYGAFRFLGWLP